MANSHCEIASLAQCNIASKLHGMSTFLLAYAICIVPCAGFGMMYMALLLASTVSCRSISHVHHNDRVKNLARSLEAADVWLH